MLLSSQLRVGSNITKFVFESSSIGVGVNLNKYVSLSPSYTYIYTQQPTTRNRTFESRLGFNFTARPPAIKRFAFSNRHLVERRLRHPSVDATRYRIRLQVERPVKIGSAKFNLMASDEIFYDSSFRAWSRNRFLIGASKRLDKRLTGDVYYLRQNDGRTRPGDFHVLGTLIRLRF